MSINLARIAPFHLGALQISPATRQIERSGNSETLEPRVMQVLVALARANGAVVTRDDLIATCWDGRFVGDNAIQRTISLLRNISNGLGEGYFRVETVNKVGYRLIQLATEKVGPESSTARPTPVPRRRHRTFVLGTAVLTLAAFMVALIAWTRWPASRITTIALVAQDGRAAELADGLAIDLARFANARSAPIVFVKGSRPNYRLGVSNAHSGNRIQADITLSKAGSPDVLWSATFTAPPFHPGLLRERAASTVSALIQCAAQTNNDLAQSPDDALRPVLFACERVDDDADAGTVAAWQRVVAIEPDNAPAAATLSFLEASWAVTAAQISAAPAPQIAALRAVARQHFEKARSVDRHLGLTYAAEATMIPLQYYSERARAIQHGLAEDPTCAPLHALMSAVLADLGRLDEAIVNARLAVSQAPNSASFRSELISRLAYSGYIDDAQSELRAAERLWPDSPAIREVRSRIDFRFGDPAAHIRKIDRGIELPNTSRDLATGVMRAFLLARAEPTPANVDAAATLAVHFIGTPQTLQNLVGLGRVDQAYRVTADPRRLVPFEQNGLETLFRVQMRPFRLDRRFMALANRLGLVRYWHSSNAWPDFCRDKDLPYNCKAEARRLLHY